MLLWNFSCAKFYLADAFGLKLCGK